MDAPYPTRRHDARPSIGFLTWFPSMVAGLTGLITANGGASAHIYGIGILLLWTMWMLRNLLVAAPDALPSRVVACGIVCLLNVPLLQQIIVI